METPGQKRLPPDSPILTSYNISGDLSLRNLHAPANEVDVLSAEIFGVFYPNTSTVIAVLQPQRPYLVPSNSTGGVWNATRGSDEAQRQRLRDAAVALTGDEATQEAFDHYEALRQGDERQCDLMIKFTVQPRLKQYTRTEWDKGTLAVAKFLHARLEGTGRNY